MPNNKEYDQQPPLVAHVIYRLAVGGLENGLVNLINHMPADRARHVIICITDFTDFAHRIHRKDVDIIAMHKKPGKDPRFYWRMWRLFRKLRPDILHTRNLGAIDIVVPAFLAGIKFRVQGEHGRDTSDIDGSNSKYLLFRRILNPFVSHYIALSQDLYHWLQSVVGVTAQKITQIYNGVDCARFNQALTPAKEIQNFKQQGKYLIGTVGRLQAEKNQKLIISAFAQMIELNPALRSQVVLIIVGDGPDRQMLRALVEFHHLEDQVFMAGARNDVPNFLAGFDLFVLSSLIEGVSNTILEAMCMGLPVLATDVGGNRELLVDGETGTLVASEDSSAMANALLRYCQDKEWGKSQGERGKQRVLTQFTMAAMVENYLQVYARSRRQ